MEVLRALYGKDAEIKALGEVPLHGTFYDVENGLDTEARNDRVYYKGRYSDHIYCVAGVDDSLTLWEVNIKIPLTHIAGPSGSGKSTMCNEIGKCYDLDNFHHNGSMYTYWPDMARFMKDLAKKGFDNVCGWVTIGGSILYPPFEFTKKKLYIEVPFKRLMKQIIQRDIGRNPVFTKYHKHGLYNTNMFVLQTEEEIKETQKKWSQTYKRAGYKFIAPTEKKVKGGDETASVIILSLVRSPWFIAMLVILLTYLAYKIYTFGTT